MLCDMQICYIQTYILVYESEQGSKMYKNWIQNVKYKVLAGKVKEAFIFATCLDFFKIIAIFRSAVL